ncbi:unnamed protein product [Tilletia controversa]|nr:unnamed protein product [Tilletia controversa]
MAAPQTPGWTTTSASAQHTQQHTVHSRSHSAARLAVPTKLPFMQIYALLIFANPPGASAVSLVGAWELGSFSFFQRGTIQDVMSFMSKTVAERTQPTQRQSIQENNTIAHVHARPASDGIVGVLVTDTEYPVRVAFSLLNKSLDEFLLKVPKASWSSQVSAITTGSQEPPPGKSTLLVSESVFPQAQDFVKRYQDPRQADNIMKVQQELDETKIVLHQTIDSVLQRGEDLDKLVEKSQSLSTSSKAFYKTAKKQISHLVPVPVEAE